MHSNTIPTGNNCPFSHPYTVIVSRLIATEKITFQKDKSAEKIKII
jgi:hypothetical protein